MFCLLYTSLYEAYASNLAACLNLSNSSSLTRMLIDIDFFTLEHLQLCLLYTSKVCKAERGGTGTPYQRPCGNHQICTAVQRQPLLSYRLQKSQEPGRIFPQIRKLAHSIWRYKACTWADWGKLKRIECWWAKSRISRTDETEKSQSASWEKYAHYSRHKEQAAISINLVVC